jgi:peptide/nickel transport system ATP-binding protein
MELNDEGLREYRWKEVSMVFQGAMSSLNPVKKVGYQLVDTILDHTRLKRQEAIRLAEAALKKVRLPEDVLERFPHQLSGGQKQRVVIAMAIALNPRLIIADEPTTALDVLTQEKILTLLRDIVRSTGSAILFISHDLSVLAKICDRIAVMYMGRILEMGRKEDVLFSPAHPYTKGLIDSNITIDKRGSLVQPVGGSPDLVVGDVRGCRFNPRCAHATPECVASEPPRLEYRGGRSVYCYHPRYVENE